MYGLRLKWNIESFKNVSAVYNILVSGVSPSHFIDSIHPHWHGLHKLYQTVFPNTSCDVTECLAVFWGQTLWCPRQLHAVFKAYTYCTKY